MLVDKRLLWLNLRPIMGKINAGDIVLKRTNCPWTWQGPIPRYQGILLLFLSISAPTVQPEENLSVKGRKIV